MNDPSVTPGAPTPGAPTPGVGAPTAERPASRRAQATRAALLAAGERLLAAGGLDALTSTRVAEAAGVSTGTFYVHFDDKHALLAELFARRLDEVASAVEAELSSDHLLDRGLAATLRGAVEVVAAGYRDHAPVLRAALGRMGARADLRAVYWQRHARATRALERFVQRAQAAGMAGEVAPRETALAMLVLTEGLNHPVVLAADDAAAGVRARLADALAALLRPGG